MKQQSFGNISTEIKRVSQINYYPGNWLGRGGKIRGLRADSGSKTDTQYRDDKIIDVGIIEVMSDIYLV